MTDDTKQPNSNLKDSVLTRLETEAITPRSKMWWRCQECLVWVLWGASIIFGALSVAVIIFAGMHAGYALFEATHDSPLSFVVETLPFIWLGIFVVMGYLAYRNLRNTKRGYKYPFAHILGSSVVFSVLGGVLLHVGGVGHMLDSGLGKMMPLYVSQEEREMRLWQDPMTGRLVGVIERGTTSPGFSRLRDTDGIVWQLNVMDLHQPDLEILRSGHQVRILGLYPSSTAHTLHACGVFPWMFDKKVTLDDMKSERKAFVERMYAHKDNAVSREAALVESAFGDMAMGLCADMPAIRRIGEAMEGKRR